MDTPVLLIGFNRPDLTRKVIERLLEVGAQNVYVSLDGPRENMADDAEKCRAVRNIIDTAAWPGVFRKRYLDVNVGCRRGVSGAIDWFFSQEDEGIILEDDCLPDASFFEFAGNLLARFRDDPRIGSISGTTYFPVSGRENISYCFSKYPLVWGWATWKRAWSAYDAELERLKGNDSEEILKSVSYGSSAFVSQWTRNLEDVFSERIDTWDYVWAFSVWSSQMLAIIPHRNLVSNLGFSEMATHTRKKPIAKAFRPNAVPLNTLMVHPIQIEPNARLDFLTRELIMGVHGKTARTAARILWLVILKIRQVILLADFRKNRA